MATASEPLDAGRSRVQPRALADLAFRAVCQGAALLVVALLGLLVVFLVIAAWPAITTYGFGFLLSGEWDPQNNNYGALNFIWGTLITSALAMLLAVPLGIGTAVYLAEVANGWVRRTGAFLVELLAAIPSVVYGFWGYYFLRPGMRVVFSWIEGPLQSLSEVPGFGWVYVPNASGNGILTASIILAIMILPYITAITFDVCQAVPRSQREGALALGATRWQMIWSAVLPYARPGILGGCFLALGRALGETMAILMLIGSNYQRLDLSPLGTGATIASVIAGTFSESTSSLQKSVLVELGLVLLLVTVAINCLARMLIWRVQSGKGGWFPRRPVKPSGPTADLAPATATAPAQPPQPEVPRGQNRFAGLMDRLMTAVLIGCLVVSLGPLFLILGYITYRGVTALDWHFFTSLPLDRPPGLAHALLGTAMLVGAATLVAVPVGVFASIYLAEYKNSRLVPVVRFVGELLAGVPSIIIGIFGYAVVGRFTGPSGWAGVFALSVMMVPVVMRTSEEALKLVPQTLRSASYALGAAHWQTVLRVTVPAALSAIITGIFLSVARIAGETAPLLLTADASSDWNLTLVGPTPYLTYYIYFYATHAGETQQQLAWAAAFVLLALVMALNVGVRLLTGKRQVSAARAD